MILFERERRALDFAVKCVRRLRPGERITLGYRDLADIPRMEHNGAVWNPADRVLENIMGSSFEFSYQWDHLTNRVTFERLLAPLEDGRRSYVSPDRRHLFTWYGCGTFSLKQPDSPHRNAISGLGGTEK